MLTPLEIHNKEFKRTFRGYDEDEVDEFLDQVIADYEQLYRENIDLRESANKAEGNTGQYKDLEDTLKNALVVAQQTSDQMKANAEKEAKIILQDANSKAEQIINSAHDKYETIVKDYENLKNQVNLFKVKLRSFLEMQMTLVDEYGEEKVEKDNQRTIINDVPEEKTQPEQTFIGTEEVITKEQNSDKVQDDNSVTKIEEQINTFDLQKPVEPARQNTIIFSKEEIAAAIDNN